MKSFIGTHDERWQDDRMYRHDSLEITFIMEGSGRFRTEAEEMSVEGGQVVCIRPGTLHSFHAVTPIRFGVILTEGAEGVQLAMFEALLAGKPYADIRLSPAHRERYEALFRLWLRVLSAPAKDPEAVYSTWLQLFLVFLSESDGAAGREVLSVARAAESIRQRFRDRLSVGMLASLCGLSEDGFRRQFYRAYGMTPKQFQQQCRVSEAKWMLSSTSHSVQEVGEAVGYATVHAFSAWFKKETGLAPTEWKATLTLNRSGGADRSIFE
ncbi:helix-turn-helix domain-containing protein [Paenibacillus antri]|uniref:Helix-turn-helix domain-containing protein n=1 Tax=Paenibacillus antri TaxID=2582848 RepID=A0A5R9GCH6_9BACL|nr:AraC family transcriptional regulator [Paenibacillus antri]TLS54172.1 helix-turn-helix domain-containing protein [Paenibacillus antri]